jgi:hypothetical protein
LTASRSASKSADVGILVRRVLAEEVGDVRLRKADDRHTQRVEAVERRHVEDDDALRAERNLDIARGVGDGHGLDHRGPSAASARGEDEDQNGHDRSQPSEEPHEEATPTFENRETT